MSSSELRPPDGDGLRERAEVHVPVAPPVAPPETPLLDVPPSPLPIGSGGEIAESANRVVAGQRVAGEQVAANDSLRPSPVGLEAAPQRLSPMPTSPVKHDAQRPPEKETDALPPLLSLSDMVLEAPPWLFSAALHMIAVIILGLIFVVPASTDALLLRFDYTDNLGEDMTGDDLDISLDLLDEQNDSALDPQEVSNLDETPLVEAAEILPELPDQPLSPNIAPIRMALTGREKGMQQKLLVAYGGTGATQQAVTEGLRWLARNQGRQGLWSMRGRYADGAASENHEAATGLALLAFQGAGITPEGSSEEPFVEIVARAWRTLLKKQKEDGNFFQEGRSHAQLYTHAICTIAICELYGMTGKSKYREPAQRAVNYCVKAQSDEGGWRYFPGSGSDLSVTGWFVMALQSARMAGLEVPSPTLSHVKTFLDSASRESGIFYAYQPASAATPAMTAEGLLCRQYLGWEQSDWRLQKGGNFLIRNLPVWEEEERDVYYWYYATQVCHHLEGKHWRRWNDVMRVVLPAHQIQEGKERGSWDPEGDAWGDSGGRLYVTCLSIYMLEVYYRHLPIYQLEKLSGQL